MALLAQNTTVNMFIWIGILMVFVFVGFVLVSILRAWTKKEPETRGLLLSDFRRMRDEGQLSDEEYRQILSGVRRTSMSTEDGSAASRETTQPVPVEEVGVCVCDLEEDMLPEGAVFCPRCGKPVRPD